MVTHCGDDLCLFYGVDAEVCFKLIIKLDLIGVVACLFAQHIEQALRDIRPCHAALSGLWCGCSSGRALSCCGFCRAPGLCNPEHGERIKPGAKIAFLGVVGVNGDMLTVTKDAADKGCLRTFGANLNKDARAIVVHLLDHGHELHGSCHLMGEQIADFIGASGVVTTCDIGQDWGDRHLDIKAPHVFAQGF